MVKNQPTNAQDVGSILGSEDPLAKEMATGNLLQYSCLENPRDRVAWWAAVHGVAKSWTCLRDGAYTHTHTHTHTLYKKEEVRWKQH